MNRTVFYSVIASAFFLAILLGLIIFPYYKPLSLMYYFNKDFEKSYDRYLGLYQAEDHSVSVVGPLIILNLDYANIPEAISLLEQYTEENPTSIDSWKYLANIYQGTDRPHSYLWALQNQYNLDPNASLIKEQIAFQTFYGHTSKLLELYRTFLTDFSPDTWECASAAMLFAAEGLEDEAINAADQGLQISSSAGADRYLATIYLSLLLDKGKIEKAKSFATGFVKKYPNENVAVDLANTFRDKKHYPEALALLDSLPPDLSQHPATIQSKVIILFMQGNEEGVYSFLKELSLVKKLPQNQLENFVSLGLVREKDSHFFEKTVASHSMSTLTESSLFTLLRKAYNERLPLLLGKLKETLSERSNATSPLLIYAMELTSLPLDSNNPALYAVPQLEDLSVEEELQLALLYDDLGLEQLAQWVLQEIRNYNRIPLKMIIPLASLLNKYHLSALGFEQISTAKSNMRHPPLEFDIAWGLLALGSGHTQEVLTFLETSTSKLSNDQLQILALTALAFKNEEVSLVLASTLVERDQKESYQQIYAEALILNGEIEKGVSILEKLYAAASPPSINLIMAYLHALAIASGQNPWYVEALHDLIAKHIDDLKANPTRLREAAYVLADAGLKNEAALFLFMLVKNEPYQTDDMQSLLYLWGDNLSEEQVEWIASKAALSEGKEKSRWIQALNNAKQYALTYQLIEEKDLAYSDIVDAYFETLTYLHKQDELKALIYNHLIHETDVERLKKLGKLAYDTLAEEAAEILFLHVLNIDPYSKDSLKYLGEIYFSKGAFSYANWYLSLYLNLYEGDYLTYYEMAEIFYRDADYSSAFPFYIASLIELQKPTIALQEATSTAPAEDLYREIVRAQIYARVRYPRTALILYEELLAHHPQDINIRANYGNLLIDLDSLDYAGTILFDFDVPIASLESKDESALLYLETVRTLWWTRSRFMDEATNSALNNMTAYPGKGDPWASLANIKNSCGFGLKALDNYASAHLIAPYNEDYLRAYSLTLDPYRPYALGEREYRKTGATQKEHFTRFGAAWNDSISSQFQLYLESDNFELLDYTQPSNGLVIPKKTGTRCRGEASWLYHYPEGVDLLSQVYFGKHHLGWGVKSAFLDCSGSWIGGIEYNRPNWDYVSTLADYGARNRLYVERTQLFSDRLAASLFIAGNRYFMGQVHGIAGESIGWQMAINYRLCRLSSLVDMFGHDSTLVLSYSVDAEYPTWQARKSSLDGTCFEPLALSELETQTLQFILNKSLHRWMKFQANFGFAYDRFGVVNRVDWVYGASLNWDKRPGATFKLLYDHSPSATQPGQNVDRFLFNLDYYY